MTAVQIYIKLLSGDMFPLDVAPRISIPDLYVAVYHALPKDIQPEKVYQLQLLLPQEAEKEEQEEEKEKEKEKEEKGDVMLDLNDGDVISVLLSDATYELFLDYICEAQDMEDNAIYERYRIEIVSGRDIVYSKNFYTNPFADQDEYSTTYILPILPSMEIQPDEDQNDLELFRLPLIPPSARLPPQAHFCISREDLLADFPCGHILRQHLLVLLEHTWKKEQYYAEHGHNHDDDDDDDDGEDFE
jgi:hypothetical protein